MRPFRLKTSHVVICCAALLLASGCGSIPSEPPGPLDPALRGNWAIPSVDTWLQLRLEQRGASVIGTFGYDSPISKPDTCVLSGTAALPHVVLARVQDGNEETFDATPSADQQSLAGTVNGESGLVTFHRE